MSDLTGWTAEFLAGYRSCDLDEEVRERAKMHLLDTTVAILSGAHLKPGRLVRSFVAGRAAAGRATVAGCGQRTAPELAALANGMAAHSDETDDANDLARMHPGASVVPAAIAAAEHAGASGDVLLRAVSAGYDLGVGIVLAAWEPGSKLRQSVQSTHGTGQLFGAAGAASVVSDLGPDELRQVLSYTAQQAAGLSSFFRDTEHVEKAFAIGGREAHDGVRAVAFVEAGFTGLDDIFDGTPNFFDAFGIDGDPARLPETVDRRHLLTTDLKQFPVGMPIQAAAQALKEILEETGIQRTDVERVEAHLPSEKAWVVDDRAMPSIHLQYVLAILLIDGRLTFDNTHDVQRHHDPDVRSLMARIELVHSRDLDPPPTGEGSTRRAIVRVHLRGGATREVRVDPARGSRSHPLSWPDVEEKARNVLADRYAASVVDDLVGAIHELDGATDCRRLTETFAAGR